MAIVWQKMVDNIDYQVRSAGNTRRLYTDGVFHSQYNPKRPVTGSVWDLLLLPAFLHPTGKLRRVLVLGVGGGAVINQLNAFLSPECIEAVELNPVHLRVARRFFGVDRANVNLHQADAVQWLKNYRGPKFDLIIDDLFGEQDGEPCRAVAAEKSWCQLLRRKLSADGTLVMNFDTPAGRRDSYWHNNEIDSWSKYLEFSTPLYSNSVGVWSRQSADDLLNRFRANLCRFPDLDANRKSCKLSYRMREIR